MMTRPYRRGAYRILSSPPGAVPPRAYLQCGCVGPRGHDTPPTLARPRLAAAHAGARGQPARVVWEHTPPVRAAGRAWEMNMSVENFACTITWPINNQPIGQPTNKQNNNNSWSSQQTTQASVLPQCHSCVVWLGTPSKPWSPRDVERWPDSWTRSKSASQSDCTPPRTPKRLDPHYVHGALSSPADHRHCCHCAGDRRFARGASEHDDLKMTRGADDNNEI